MFFCVPYGWCALWDREPRGDEQAFCPTVSPKSQQFICKTPGHTLYWVVPGSCDIFCSHMLGLICDPTVTWFPLASRWQGKLPSVTRVPCGISGASLPCSTGTVCPLHPHPLVIPAVQQHALLGLRQFLVHLTVLPPNTGLCF